MKYSLCSTLPLHVIPILVILWISKSFLFGVFLCYLTLFSQDCFFKSQLKNHKVSICITLMCMMISCFCTYCLQGGFINMKVNLSIIFFGLMHIAKIHVTHYLLSHAMHSRVLLSYMYMI